MAGLTSPLFLIEKHSESRVHHDGDHVDLIATRSLIGGLEYHCGHRSIFRSDAIQQNRVEYLRTGDVADEGFASSFHPVVEALAAHFEDPLGCPPRLESVQTPATISSESNTFWWRLLKTPTGSSDA